MISGRDSAVERVLVCQLARDEVRVEAEYGDGRVTVS